jgi:hypothetical protein
MEPVRYIIVVHGMGQARYNETVLAVVNRFAEARNAETWPPPPDIVSLGMACGQTGTEQTPTDRPWLEFAGIATNPEVLSKEPFLGKSSDGDNLRFIDMHWGDLLDGAWPDVGQDPDTWLDALVGRLRRKQQAHSNVPQWVLETLGILRETVRLIHLILRFKFKSFDELVFGQYLGDVQLYGEYALARGQAVRRFHQKIAEIDAEHKKQHEKDRRPATYTVIAHSLGTVMAMDALFYAHAKDHVRMGPGAGQGVPFPGYRGANLLHPFSPAEDTKIPNVDWVENIDAFVTLGAPIDKFLTIWWLNYLYLNDTKHWLVPRKPGNRIKHFNYCEVQDPVGQHVNLLKTAEAYQYVFECFTSPALHKSQKNPSQEGEDRVYMRYAWPGLAHIAYWQDSGLFRWILGRAVDGKKVGELREPQWYSSRIHKQILFITYIAIPLIVILLDVYTWTLACRAQGAHAAIPAALVLFITTLLGRYAIELLVYWRQALRSKHNRVTDAAVVRDAAQWIRALPQRIGLSHTKGLDDSRRFDTEAEFRASLGLIEYGSLAFAAILASLYRQVDPQLKAIPVGRMILVGCVFFVAGLIWYRFFQSQDATWRKSLSHPEGPPPPPDSPPNSPPDSPPNAPPNPPPGGGTGSGAPSSASPEKPLDLSQQLAGQLWIRPDLINAGKAIVALAIGFGISYFLPSHPRFVSRFLEFFKLDAATATYAIFGLISTGVLCAAVFGYVRYRMAEINAFLMTDREKPDQNNVRNLKPQTFAEYLGIKSTPPDPRPDEGGPTPTGGDDNPGGSPSGEPVGHSLKKHVVQIPTEFEPGTATST